MPVAPVMKTGPITPTSMAPTPWVGILKHGLPQPPHRIHAVLHGHILAVACRPRLHFHHARGGLLAHRHADRAADQFRVGELIARPLPRGRPRARPSLPASGSGRGNPRCRTAVRLWAAPAPMDVERRDGLRPHDAAHVGVLLHRRGRDARGPIPYEPMMMSRSWPDSSRTVAFSGLVYLVPSLKMLPTSMTTSIVRGAPHSGTVVTGLSLAQIRPLGGEVTAGDDAPSSGCAACWRPPRTRVGPPAPRAVETRRPRCAARARRDPPARRNRPRRPRTRAPLLDAPPGHRLFRCRASLFSCRS